MGQGPIRDCLPVPIGSRQCPSLLLLKTGANPSTTAPCSEKQERDGGVVLHNLLGMWTVPPVNHGGALLGCVAGTMATSLPFSPADISSSLFFHWSGHSCLQMACVCSPSIRWLALAMKRASYRVLLLKSTLSMYVEAQFVLIFPGSSEKVEVLTLVMCSGL